MSTELNNRWACSFRSGTVALNSEASFRAQWKPLWCTRGRVSTFAGLAFCARHQANAGIDDAALYDNSLLTTPLSGQSEASGL